ncbi:cryptococcal mannosyltransferase 1-domain-containing protein [Mycena olivaceomarginata]|nr:cryptococcal mannosyltransferase 1-domain-containing protein [Mycena olivaceomarginata]
MLGRGFPPAFPESRALFVTTLLTVPTWAFCMCIGYLCWMFELSLGNCFTRWRNPHGNYTELVFNQDEEIERCEEHPSPRAGAHKTTSRIQRPVAFIALWSSYFSLVILGVYLLVTYELPVDHRYKVDVQLANRVPKRDGYASKEKIFLAAMFYNNARVVPYWTVEITKLINYLGSDNVFVSIVESYSTDATPALLRDFDRKLEAMGVPRRILTQETSIPRPASSTGTQLPHIEYLANLRNLAMEPLGTQGAYDRVLFSNDVFVEAESIVELLNTKGGDYDMACGLDFHNRGYVIRPLVLRDRLGHLASALWPYFLEDTGFRAVMTNEPAPVFACWNGIIAVRADPFLPIPLRKGQLSTIPLTQPLPTTHPAYPRPLNTTPASTSPVRFRASKPGECFSSESFLLPYDLRRQFAMKNIYANPRVITAYEWRFYVWFKYILRHWAVKWFIERVENGNGMHLAKFVLGNPAEIWQWDGSECHPAPG